jgi:large subunit ribosomal protein L25
MKGASKLGFKYFFINFILFFGGFMKLQTVKRAADSKSENKRLRREGFIPAVLYIKEQKGETIAVNANEFSSYLRQVKPGHLPTTIFTLVDKDGRERRVVIKEIQYAITTYAVTHLDFEELVEDHKINIKVPIECIGQVDCVGIKLGGVLRQVIRHVRVRCLPKDLPSYFELDIRELELNQSKRLVDLRIPKTVRPLVDLNEVVAVIVKR